MDTGNLNFMIKKASKKITFVLLIMVLGGLGGIVADKYIFPYLSTTAVFSHYAFLKKSTQDVTVINKTEQVFMKEETSVSKVVSRVASSVVNIVSYSDPGNKTAKKMAPTAKNGTGLVITSDGLIMTYVSAINLTNSKYKVTIPDGNTFEAELKGVDSFSNLAFLKISANNLQAVSFGNSDDSSPGEKVIAIGNSSGSYSNRYAAGLFSNLNYGYNLSGKTVSSSEKLEGVFETDFNFEQYYVGGPIVDYASQVIGVVGTIDRDGKPEYFQISSNRIKQVIDREIKGELDKNPILGIYYLPIDKNLALINSLAVEKGAWIYSSSNQQGLAIIEGSPAQKAGLKLNDIVTTVNNDEISNQKSLSNLLYTYKKGDIIELGIVRDGQNMKISVQL